MSTIVRPITSLAALTLLVLCAASSVPQVAPGLPGFPFTAEAARCQGRYCGRLAPGGECGACPRGYTPDPVTSVCVECSSQPQLYDWLYLSFMAVVSLVLHWQFIAMASPPTKAVILLQVSALVECVLAAVLTLVLTRPLGEFTLTSCPVTQFSDWYTMFYNPTPDYETTVYCTQEAVHPLYTIVLVYYTLSLILMMLVRPLLAHKLPGCQGSRSIYAALYFLPILIVVHSVLAGVIYFAFPYITIFISLITNACHLANEDYQRTCELLRRSFTSGRSLCVLLGHWAIQAFGMVSISTQLQQPSLHGPLLALVPCPTLFYILTVRFTDPNLIFPFRTSSLQGV